MNERAIIALHKRLRSLIAKGAHRSELLECCDLIDVACEAPSPPPSCPPECDGCALHVATLTKSVSPLEAPVTPASSPPKPADAPVPPSTQALSLAQTPGGDTDAVERCADCGWWPTWGAHACDFRQRMRRADAAELRAECDAARAEAEKLTADMRMGAPELSRRERGFDPELARRAAERTIP